MRYTNLRNEILNVLNTTRRSPVFQPTVSFAGGNGRCERAYVDANGGTSMMSSRSRGAFLRGISTILQGRFNVRMERRPSGQPVLVVQ